jgi:uncharacterized protein with PCYCGC motif
VISIDVKLRAEKRLARRSFLKIGGLTIASITVPSSLIRTAFGAAHRYKLAPESILPAEIRRAPLDVREAYRFAVVNRDTLRYIPCYCGCADAGHTSNASCYVEDSSPPEHPRFDRMSLG